MRKEKIEISFDWDYLDNLPIEKYNKLEEEYAEFVQKLLIKAEEDYCKKKGISLKKVKQDWVTYNKMRNAINNRKIIKKVANNLLMFNKAFRYLTK